MSDLDNRLESLTDGPAPALAPAALVRGRGEQRRRRTRLSVAVVSAAVLVTGGFAYESLSGSWNGRTPIQYASVPTATAAPTTTVTATPDHTEEPPGTGLSSGDVLRRDGIGGVIVGMTVAQAQTAAGQKLVREGPSGSCVHMVPESRDPALFLMFVDGVMSRVDVEPGSATRTREGIGIGSTEQQVKDAYPGKIVVEPSFYNPSRHLLHLKPDARAHSMIFSTDGAKVTSFRAGLEKAVRAIEGCS